MNPEFSDPEYQRLIRDKAEKLEALRKRKPGEKHYKQSLAAFLEADARTQKALLEQIDREPRHFDRRHSAQAGNED